MTIREITRDIIARNTCFSSKKAVSTSQIAGQLNSTPQAERTWEIDDAKYYFAFTTAKKQSQ